MNEPIPAKSFRELTDEALVYSLENGIDVLRTRKLHRSFTESIVAMMKVLWDVLTTMIGD